MEHLNQSAASLALNDYVQNVIWGPIPITELEREIIQQTFFTRLLEVKQMGVASVEFVSAIHSRYEHSLGVMHAADQLLSMIKFVRASDKKEMYLGEYPAISGEVRQALRIAALLHDIGHPPFSHVVEEALRKYPDLIELDNNNMTPFLRALVKEGRYSHENATQYWIAEVPAVGEILSQRYGITDVGQLSKLAVGQANLHPFNLLNPIINGDLDADKIDYLIRDGYYCGFRRTFNILDFDGAVRIEQAKNLDENPRITVSSSAVGAINTFLHTRYRLIDEIHNRQKPRIATQLVIENVANLLREKNESERAQLVQDFHLEYRDHDLENVFKGEREEQFDLIRRGQVDYEELYLPPGADRPIEFYDCTPIQRLCIHTIVSYPPAIARVQNILRQETHSDHVIVDIRNAKPPKFSLNVNERPDYQPTVFTVSDTTRGLLRDSVTNLKVHIYKKRGTPIDYSVSKLMSVVPKVALWSLEELFTEKKVIFGPHLLLTVISAIIDHAQKDLGILNPWISGQWHLQHMISQICEEADIHCPYSHLKGEVSDPDFVRDIVILESMGILNERAITVRFPGKNNHRDKFVIRHDYTVNLHAVEFNKLIDSLPIRSITERITYVTKHQQNSASEDLKQYADDEDALAPFRVEPDVSGVATAISQRRQELRTNLKTKVCFVIR